MVNDLPMGPVCATKAPPPFQGPDLLGFDIDAAVLLAKARVHLVINALAIKALVETSHDFAAARGRLGL
jgi:hypothetical protein